MSEQQKIRAAIDNEVIRAVAVLRQQKTVARDQDGQTVFVSGTEAAREYLIETLDRALAGDSTPPATSVAAEARCATLQGAVAADEERLRQAAARAGVLFVGCDTADALADRCATLTAALEPFAALAECYDPPEGDDHEIAWDRKPTLGQLRSARAALQSTRPQEQPPEPAEPSKPSEPRKPVANLMEALKKSLEAATHQQGGHQP